MKRSARFCLLAVAALGGGCAEGRAPAPTQAAVPPALLVTLALAKTSADELTPVLPDGARLLRVEPGRVGVAPIDLGAGLAAAGQPRVSYDGRWILFTARESADQPWSLWRCRPDGSERERAVGGTRDQVSGAWLPDGRIVCAEALPDGEAGAPRRWALSVAVGDGRAAQRITFSAGSELDPEVLPDGRIVFAAWRATPAGASFALWCVHPDGTGADLYHRPQAEAALLRRPRMLADGRLVALVGASATTLSARLVDARAPLGPSTVLPGGWAALLAVEPLQDGGLLVVGQASALAGASAASEPASGLTRLGPDGARMPLAVVAAGERVLDVAVLEPRSAPQGHLSLVDAGKDWGQVLVLDARPPGGSSAAWLRLLAGDPADPAGARRLLGGASLAEDGSVFVRVPSDVPLWFEVLAPDGSRLARTHAPLWVRPNETRGCVGCHDERDTAPPNLRPLAVHAPAVLPSAEGGAAAAEVAR